MIKRPFNIIASVPAVLLLAAASWAQTSPVAPATGKAPASPPVTTPSPWQGEGRGGVNGQSANTKAPIVTLYGHSVQGRDLVAYTFGDGPNKTLILAAIHGNERNVRPLAERLIAYFTANQSAYAACTVTVVPCVNPDGWEADTRVNADAVDLNRNFPVGWHGNQPGKLKRGTGPLSEPESKALAVLIMQLMPQKIVSIHNPLHMIDAEGAHSVALANVLSAYNHYPVPKAGVGYPTPGSLGQFAEQFGIAIVTLELPRESVDDAWDQNLQAILATVRVSSSDLK